MNKGAMIENVDTILEMLPKVGVLLDIVHNLRTRYPKHKIMFKTAHDSIDGIINDIGELLASYDKNYKNKGDSKMNELINVSYENDTPTVLGRDLHEMLEVQTAYKDWFPRMCEYGFIESKDYNPLIFERVQNEGNRQVTRNITDHQLTLNMAKEICMIQRSEKGKQCREYFISIEEQWNSPEAVMSRALKFADRKIESLTKTNIQLLQENEIMKPKSAYYDLVLNSKGALPTTVIAKDYGKSAKWLNEKLRELGIQYKQSDVWVLYQKYADKGYTQSRTFPIPDAQSEIRNYTHTYWTQKGRLFIYETLKKEGIVPTSEKIKGA